MANNYPMPPDYTAPPSYTLPPNSFDAININSSVNNAIGEVDATLAALSIFLTCIVNILACQCYIQYGNKKHQSKPRPITPFSSATANLTLNTVNNKPQQSRKRPRLTGP